MPCRDKVNITAAIKGAWYCENADNTLLYQIISIIEISDFIYRMLILKCFYIIISTLITFLYIGASFSIRRLITDIIFLLYL